MAKTPRLCQLEKLVAEIETLRSSVSLGTEEEASIIRKGPEEAAFSADPPTEMLVPNNVENFGDLSADPFSEDSIIFSCPPPDAAAGGDVQQPGEPEVDAAEKNGDAVPAFVPFAAMDEISQTQGSWMGARPYDDEDVVPMRSPPPCSPNAELVHEKLELGKPEDRVDIPGTVEAVEDKMSPIREEPGSTEQEVQLSQLEPVSEPADSVHAPMPAEEAERQAKAGCLADGPAMKDEGAEPDAAKAEGLLPSSGESASVEPPVTAEASPPAEYKDEGAEPDAAKAEGLLPSSGESASVEPPVTAEASPPAEYKDPAIRLEVGALDEGAEPDAAKAEGLLPSSGESASVEPPVTAEAASLFAADAPSQLGNQPMPTDVAQLRQCLLELQDEAVAAQQQMLENKSKDLKALEDQIASLQATVNELKVL
ncbi:rha-1 [Symbiodinium natans]|uniref:Rha-1 protein n=1 Tax=Symbiodinium natans TaxID=878477 RepID=A0A812Q632_9DINO|nr:rha-1 [Symbiodinium natans]